MTTADNAVQSVETRASAFYVWHAPGRPLTVHLSLDVVERMERQVIESFKAITQRGSEIGGLLLGRVPQDQPLVVVEDYLGVSCDYARGPLYLLAEPDKARLAAALQRVKADAEKGLAVVGFFRSNTRRDLALDEDDLALMSAYFAESRQVCLLVKPFSMKPSVGGFFIWETGKIQGQSSYLQFPFRRSELSKSEHAKAIAPGAGAAAAAPGDGNGAGAAKPEARVSSPAAPAKREEPAPAPAVPPRAEVRVSIPLVIPKREEPSAAAPPKPETRASVSPATPKRETPPPPPPPLAPSSKPELRVSAPAVFAKREAPTLPPVAAKPEARAPVSPVIPKREPAAPPPSTPVAPKREESAPILKPETRAVTVPPSPKREPEVPAPPKPPSRAGITSLGLLREEPPRPPKAAAPEAAPPAPKGESGTPPPAPSRPETPTAGPTASKREEAPAVASGMEVVEPTPAREGKRGRLPYAIAAVAALFLIGVGGLMYFRPVAGKGTAAVSGPDAASLALRVERNAGQLLLSWNREATAVKAAQAAVLSIMDGDHKEDIKLELGQLRGGSIVYSPITNDVSFRLEVTDSKGQSTNETVRVIAGRPSPAAPLGQAAPAKPESATSDGRARQDTSAVQPFVPAADASAEPSPTPGGGAEPSAPVKPPPVQFRTESLAGRLSPAPNLPEPPRLESQPTAVPVRQVENFSASAPPPTQVPKPTAAQEAAGQPLRVGGNVQQALLVRSVTPNYPPLARQARVSGVVRVEATIGRDGRIVKAAAISGPPLLRQAATDAVRQWIYKPTTLNGQAVEVVTQVDVTFNLNR
jgi:protein TonB